MAIHLEDPFRLFRKVLQEAVHLDDCWASLALLCYLPHETIWIDCFFFALSPTSIGSNYSWKSKIKI